MLGGQIRSPADFEEGDFRQYSPRFSAENFPKNLKLVDQINDIAKKKNSTPSQLTLAWCVLLINGLGPCSVRVSANMTYGRLLAQGDDIFPIP